MILVRLNVRKAFCPGFSYEPRSKVPSLELVNLDPARPPFSDVAESPHKFFRSAAVRPAGARRNCQRCGSPPVDSNGCSRSPLCAHFEGHLDHARLLLTGISLLFHVSGSKFSSSNALMTVQTETRTVCCAYCRYETSSVYVWMERSP